jgi:hypothetical protein
LDCTAVRSWIANSDAHQPARQLEECIPILQIVKLSKARPIGFSEAASTGLKTPNYCP